MTETRPLNPQAEQEVPQPPRFWWLKRSALLVGLLVVILAGVRVWWGYEAQRRWDRVLAELRAHGQPVLREDYAARVIPDDLNVAVYLQNAVAAINPNADAPAATNMVYRHYPPFPRRWHRAADKAVAANANALALARQARSYEQVEWNLPLGRPVFATPLPALNQMRHLANLLGDAAMHAHVNGNDAEAIERCRDLLALARAVDRQPFLVSHLVANGIEALALHRIQVIATELQVESPRGTTGPSITPAARQQVQALIADLLNHDDTAGLLRAMQSERMAMLDGIEWMTAGNPLLEPLFQLDRVRIVRHADYTLRASAIPNWPEVQAVLAEQPAVAVPPNDVRIATVLGAMLMPAGNRVISVDLRVRTDRRLAQAALALRMYYLDHGRWPQTLEDLVPQYLPAVPLDPWVENQPIKFALILNGLPDGSPRPVVYSVGEDGRDDTAAGAVPSPQPRFSSDPKDPDQWRDLMRFTPPPTTDQPDPNDPGDDEDEEEEPTSP